MTGAIVKWGKAYQFAELAEALGVTAFDVMAAIAGDGDTITVLYTKEPGEPVVLWSQQLARDADDCLVRYGEPQEHPELWDRIVETLR